MREKVMKARDTQLNRFKGSSIRFNSEMSVSDIERFCVLKPEDEVFFEKAFRNMQLSARSYHKVLRVARTIADLDDSEMIERKHLAQALNYRLNELFM